MLEQEPGPRGSPHAPHAVTGISLIPELCPFTPAANTDSCFSTDVLLHDGQATVVDARTSVSKPLWHSLQTYSNIGIDDYLPVLPASLVRPRQAQIRLSAVRSMWQMKSYTERIPHCQCAGSELLISPGVSANYFPNRPVRRCLSIKPATAVSSTTAVAASTIMEKFMVNVCPEYGARP